MDPSLEELLPSSKLISLHNAVPSFQDAHLHKILTASGVAEESDSLPVALVAVIGASSCGKSLLTNVLLQYLRISECCEEEGETWLREIIWPGFSWEGVTNPEFYELNSPGVYLWPQPFMLEVSPGRPVMVGVLHAYSPRVEDLEQLEKLLVMVCARVLEIKCSGKNDEIRLLERYSAVEQHQPLCRSAVIALRSAEPQSRSEKVGQFLLRRVEDSATRQRYHQIVEKFRTLQLSWIPEAGKEEPLHDKLGRLKLSPDMVKTLEATVELFLEKETLLEAAEKAGVTLGSLQRVFQRAVTALGGGAGGGGGPGIKKRQSRLQLAISPRPPAPPPSPVPRAPEETSEETPPLVVHLRSRGIEMAVQKEDKFTRLFDRHHPNKPVPGTVALTTDDEVVYGSQVTSGGRYQFVWTLAQMFSPKHVARRWPHGGEEHRLPHEFMLALLLHHLHRNLPGSRKILILVPVWLSSLQRVQIQDAARLAGFAHVRLLNESSAAAYTFVARPGPIDCGQVLILTENWNRIDIFLYAYQRLGTTKEVKMLTHRSYYGGEEEDPAVGCSMVNKFWNKFTCADKQLKYCFGKRTVEGVRLARQTAIRDAQQKYHEWLHLSEFLVICDHDDKWAHLLIAMGNGSQFKRQQAVGVQRRDAVLQGACLLGERWEEMGGAVRDRLPFPVLVHETRNNVCWQIWPKGCQLPVGVKGEVLPVPRRTTGGKTMEIRIYQELFGETHGICEVKIPDPGWNGRADEKEVRMVVGINGEGVVGMEEVVNVESWKSGYLSEESFEVLRGLLEKLTSGGKGEESGSGGWSAQLKIQVRAARREEDTKVAAEQVERKLTSPRQY